VLYKQSFSSPKDLIPNEQNEFQNFLNYSNNGNATFGNKSNQMNNYYSNSFDANNYYKYKNNNEYQKKKPFIERVGDWTCFNCHNLNFSFRTNCNRCHITKKENQILIEKNLYLLVNKK
jgi:ribosomal protein S27AE